MNVKAQKSEDRIKASMLFYLCDYIEWPENFTKDAEFTFGLAGASPDFYDELNQIVKSGRTIHGKELSVQNIAINNIPKNIHVLFLGASYFQNAESVLDYCKENAILLVTDKMNNNVFSVINFYFNEEKEAINFEVNKQNIILSKLNYRDDILLYGGNLLDVKELYQSTQRMLEQQVQKVNSYSNQVKEKEIELERRNQQISLLGEKISEGNASLSFMADSLEHMHALTTQSLKELEHKKEAVLLLENDYKKLEKQKLQQESIITQKESTLKELDNKIKEREVVIQKQSEDIEQKKAQLKARDKALFISLILGILVTSVGAIYVFAYRTKNKYNKLLETKVEERTSELKKSEQNYREIFNGVSDYIFILDLQGKILDVNEPMLQAYGYGRQEIELLEIVKLSDESMGYTAEKLKEMVHHTKSKGQYTFDWIAKRKNGETFWVIVTLRLTTIGGNDRLLAVVRDNDINKKNELELEKHRNHLERLVKEKTEDLEAVNEELQSTNEELFDKSEIINTQNSELKSTLQHLKETQSQLLQSEKMASLGILTAGVAHEINNPLNYILGAYSGLKKIHTEKSYEQNQETISVLLDSLKTGVKRASDIVVGLNQFSRESKTLDEDCDIHDIIDNTLVMLNNKLKHRIEIQKDFSADKIVIKGNVGNLHQVFLNIIGNAEQAINGEGIITIKTSLNTSKAYIEITDSGEGISPQNLNKITDPFFTTKDPGQGTGLGVSIVYNILKEHAGTIGFESELGKGTKVKIELPIKV